MDLGVIFLTGLTTGGLTCLAIQGGLLATAMAGTVAVQAAPAKAKTRRKTHVRSKKQSAPLTGIQFSQDLWPVVYFLAAKLVAYTLLGILLGALGAAIQITPAMQAIMQIGVGLFMLATALNMFNIHPIFRYVVIQPPKQLTRLVRNQAKSQSMFAPALLGLMTVLIPCGTTQAMEVLAISSGSPLLGALIMFVFVLGTSPTFLALGFLASRARGRLQPLLATTAALLILFLGLVSLNGGLNLLGSPLAPERLLAPVFRPGGYHEPVEAQVVEGVQQVVINAHNSGYSPDYIRAHSGEPLRLQLVTDDNLSCSLVFTIPRLGLRRVLPQTGTTVIDLPALPEGDLFFSCGMGMYTGLISLV